MAWWPERGQLANTPFRTTTVGGKPRVRQHIRTQRIHGIKGPPIEDLDSKESSSARTRFPLPRQKLYRRAHTYRAQQTTEIRRSHVFVGRGANRGALPADFFGGQRAGDRVPPKNQRRAQERGRAGRLRPVRRRPRAVGELVEVRHVEHRRPPVVEVGRLVPPLR